MATTLRGSVWASGASPPLALPLANVTISGGAAIGCTPASQLTVNPAATFEIRCPHDASGATLTVWARQYVPRVLTVGPTASPLAVHLDQRPIAGFPASRWRFDGWVLEAETTNIPSTNISFLAHPSAYRTPNGRIFLISTANTHAGPGWTQGYWQEPDSTVAVATRGPLITSAHAGVYGKSYSARLMFADGRLLMVTGLEKSSVGQQVSVLENTNLDDPSNPDDWRPVGKIVVDFTGAPTTQHEDYRLHILEGNARLPCRGNPRKFWLYVIPDQVPGSPGRACGRMGFASDQLTGPYTWCDWLLSPSEAVHHGVDCDGFPGDIIHAAGATYFVNGFGSLYRSDAPPGAPLAFTRLPNNATAVTPAPHGEWDDLHQVSFAFLPGRDGGRARLYHASYSSVNFNPHATMADFGYKQAIGMYSFDWPSDP